MNHFRRQPYQLFLCIAILLATGCTKKDIEFGNELGETYTNLLQVDTVSVNMSTYLLDSFATNGIDNFLAGSYQDSLLGDISAKAYVQLLPELGTTMEDDAVFDSLSFVIKPNDYYYGDTTQVQTITVRELAAPIEYRYGSSIYNTSSFGEKSTPLGSRSIRISPVKDDSIILSLDATKGLELFNKIKQSASEMQTADEFLNYFKGVSISIRSAAASAVFGLTKSAGAIYMRLHYHTTMPYPEAKYKDFSFYENLYSNQITSNRSGTPLASLSNNEISSALTGNRAFTQAGAGVMLKMTFPTLRNILQLDPTVRLLKATLTLKVPSGTYDGKQSLPPSLMLLQTDATNAAGSAIYNTAGDAVVTATPTYDNLYGAATTYNFELTSYFNTLLTTAGSEGNGLFLLEAYPGDAGTVNRVVISSSSSTVDNSQLVLSLLTLKNQ